MNGSFKKLYYTDETLFILYCNPYYKDFYYTIAVGDYAKTGISIWDNYDKDNWKELKNYYQIFTVEDFLERYPESENFEWETYYED